jgi:glycosyltransferase involved in cell wall biosynthesis
MLSIVIPAYNEEHRLERTLSVLVNNFRNIDIVVVFDGNDDTPKIARKFPVKLIISKNRLGKGGAIKKGILESSGEFVLILDADMPVTIEEIKKIIDLSKEADLVTVYRKFVNSSYIRIFLSKAFRIVVKLFFPSLIKIKDFQAGVKMLRRDKALEIMNELIINDFLIDVNLIYAFKRRKFSIKEVASNYYNDEMHSKISRSLLKIIILMFLSILKLRIFYSPFKRIIYTKTFVKLQQKILEILR